MKKVYVPTCCEDARTRHNIEILNYEKAGKYYGQVRGVGEDALLASPNENGKCASFAMLSIDKKKADIYFTNSCPLCGTDLPGIPVQEIEVEE